MPRRLGTADGSVRARCQPHLERLYDYAPARAGDLGQFEQIARSQSSRERFLSKLTLKPPDSNRAYAGPRARRGLSDPVDDPFCQDPGMGRGLCAEPRRWQIPSDMATGKRAQVEEERRLLYVAMTRAKGHLSDPATQVFSEPSSIGSATATRSPRAFTVRLWHRIRSSAMARKSTSRRSSIFGLAATTCAMWWSCGPSTRIGHGFPPNRSARPTIGCSAMGLVSAISSGRTISARPTTQHGIGSSTSFGQGRSTGSSDSTGRRSLTPPLRPRASTRPSRGRARLYRRVWRSRGSRLQSRRWSRGRKCRRARGTGTDPTGCASRNSRRRPPRQPSRPQMDTAAPELR
jgi:hypothetical protein